MTSNEHVDGLDGKQDIKYFLALTEITAGCSAPISHREMAALGQAGGPRSVVFPHLVWQRRNKTCLKQKSRVGQMLFSPRPAPFPSLVYGSDFGEVPAVPSAPRCRPRRACRGERQEGLWVRALPSAVTLDQPIHLPVPVFPVVKNREQSNSELPYKALGGS